MSMCRDPDLLAALDGVDLAEISITSGARLIEGEGPADAFRLDSVKGVAVVFKPAEGRKCARSWKITPDVGSDPEFPDITPRDAEAVREWQTRFEQDRLSRSHLWGPLAPLVLAVAALVFGFDQTNKWWMLFVYDISVHQPVEITSFFELVLVWNKGVSYGLFSGHQQGFLIAMSAGHFGAPLGLGEPVGEPAGRLRPLA